MFYYLQKNSLLDGEAVIILQSQSAIPNYKEIINQGELVEFEGDAIPAQWEYNEQEDWLYDIKDKPSSYHTLINKKWVVQDMAGFKKYCDKKIDTVKAEILEYGFDYEGHQQKCRDKDVAFLVSTVVGLQVAKNVLGIDKTVTWYFQDNHGEVMDLPKIATLMLYGSTFLQSVYDTESYFKTLETPKFISKEEFEAKRQEMHQLLVQGE